ncbi:hypothetical protein GOBAR_AA05802 [Gossypium barbadense]|uniref:Uncharacterized protein n=1 Tax=Gossypium barbadense TaxID=3634 RepID=A0A2P5YGS7_GOSBA|nr:hypothetical protein GOBAR_AA05802 [Gossypium barbadense]
MAIWLAIPWVIRVDMQALIDIHAWITTWIQEYPNAVPEHKLAIHGWILTIWQIWKHMNAISFLVPIRKLASKFQYHYYSEATTPSDLMLDPSLP